MNETAGGILMVDFERARAHMVDNQLRTSGVFDRRILARMRAVPREIFVPEARRALAYVDDIQWLGSAASRRFMAPPAILGRLLQLAAILETDSVLHVGAGTGYGPALLAGLAQKVTGLEANAALAAEANAHLAALGLGNAHVMAGDAAALGKARFDVIVIEGMVEAVPEALLAALEDGGRLVAPVRSGGVGIANLFVKAEGKVTARQEFNVNLPPIFAAPAVESFVF